MENNVACHVRKLVGNNNVEKLQIIMLFEANFNNINRWLSKAVMPSAEVNIYWCQNNMEAEKQSGRHLMFKQVIYFMIYTVSPSSWQPYALTVKKVAMIK